jgi:hypothetical protein
MSVQNAEKYIKELYAQCDSLTTQQLEEKIQALTEKRIGEIRNTKTEVVIKGKSFYVANDGDDSNDGLSPENAFATIDRLNAMTFIPGDVILFKKGGTFTGCFRPIGSGNETAPIKIASYGEGDARPVLQPGEDWTVEYPSWLEVSPSSGETGTYEVSVSMASDYETYNYSDTYIAFRSYDYTYPVTVVKDRPLSTTKEVIENGVDGEEYRISGYVSKINNTTYGNWYIEDETGELYIYGTTRYGGYYCPYAVGDYVTLQGPRATYNNTTIELVNAAIIGYEHTLVRFVRMDEQPIPGEGGEFKIRIECPQDDVDIAIPEDAQSWLSASSVERVNDYLIDITFTAAENTSIFRSAEVKFEISIDGRRHFTKANVQQKALEVIKKVTIAEFLAAPVDANQKYELTGVIENIVNTTYGNFDLRDETGTVYVYGLTKKGEIGPNDKSFSSIGLKVGDTVTLVGVRNEYRGTPQVGGQAYYVSHISN